VHASLKVSDKDLEIMSDLKLWAIPLRASVLRGSSDSAISEEIAGELECISGNPELRRRTAVVQASMRAGAERQGLRRNGLPFRPSKFVAFGWQGRDSCPSTSPVSFCCW
jgi:hypothetical protein